MNLFRTANIPFNFITSFSTIGATILMNVLHLYGLAYMNLGQIKTQEFVGYNPKGPLL